MFFPKSSQSPSAKVGYSKGLTREEQLVTFREHAKKMINYICDYNQNCVNLPVFPDVEPGYLRGQFPKNLPLEGEDFDRILKDFHDKVTPGILHWKHPDFYAYMNTGSALPNILGDMLSTGTGLIGFSWTANPAVTEMENLMMDWLGRALNLPKQFLSAESKGKGGGCTQGSASDSIFNCVIAARYSKLAELGCYSRSNSMTAEDPVHPVKFMHKLICYTSRESHSSIEKAANLAMVEIRLLKPDENYQITGEILERAIIEDMQSDRIPFFFSATMGSTGLAAVDDLASVGPVCKKYGMWFHVDGAYGGSAFLLPEMAHVMKGLEMADSIDINPYKFMLGAVDCGCLFLSNLRKYKKPWLIDAVYLIDKSEFGVESEALVSNIDYRHYGVPLSKRFRALKLYFLMRMYGIKGLQDYQRRALYLVKYFESLVRADDRFVVTSPPSLAIFCFRQKGPIESMMNFNVLRSDCAMSHLNRLNMNLVYRINKSRKIHLCPNISNGQYHVRISINYEFAAEEDVRRAWGIIQSFYVDKLDEEWLPERKKKTTVEEKRLQRMKSELSFVDVLEGTREMSRPRLNPSFGRFSVCEETGETNTIFRN